MIDLHELVEGSYFISYPDTCWNTSVQSDYLYTAAKEGATQAHIEWAWGAEWPLTFTVTRPDGKIFEVEVEREIRLEFHVSRCKEK
jgi:hypothetical protein